MNSVIAYTCEKFGVLVHEVEKEVKMYVGEW